METFSPESWNEAISGLQGASLLQTWEWAQLKRANGWEPLPKTWRDEHGEVCAAAMILRRRLQAGPIRTGLSVLYVPRGPLLDWASADLRARVLGDLEQTAHRLGAVMLKIDPELRIGVGIPGREGAIDCPTGLEVQAELARRGWGYSGEQVQFRNTVMLDLRGDEETWLARMKQKTRYNLRLAQRKGVVVRRGLPEDFALLYRMYAETAVRDGFVIRPEGYYRAVWETFFQRGMCAPLIAEVNGEPAAGLVLFVFAGRAWYLYGMSRDVHRELMPNYLLQWEAMRTARAMGAAEYDLWGAPDTFDERDSMWGVFRFKEGLGGTVVRTVGAWDYPARPGMYWLYTRVLPRVLDWMRRRGRQRTRREVGA